MNKISHIFVKNIPENLADNTVYVSIEYATAMHKCACGCGSKVVTPISPIGWSLNFDGDTISLHPSIGNWSFPCQSHYWVKRNSIMWAPRLTKEQIEKGRTYEEEDTKDYYDKKSK
jgi:Family of unknown function (DUF6527)